MDKESTFDSIYLTQTLNIQSNSIAILGEDEDEDGMEEETNHTHSNEKKTKIMEMISTSNYKTKSSHFQTPSRSMVSIIDLPDLNAYNSITNGGYGMYNAYDDQYDDIKYTTNDQLFVSDSSSSPASNQYMAVDTYNDDDIEQQINTYNGNNYKQQNNDEQVDGNNDKHIDENNDKNICFNILHLLGLLHFVNLIYPQINYNKAMEREKYINSLLKQISFKEVVVFESLRFYVNLYYGIGNNSCFKRIFEEIEAFCGDCIDEKQKKETLVKHWHDLVYNECNKHFYLFPVIFGWIEMISIVCIKLIFILVIFGKNEENIGYGRNLYLLSIILMIIIVLHTMGILYQFLVCNKNKTLTKILQESKTVFIGSETLNIHFNEQYITTQKWLNLLIVTNDENFKGNFMPYVIGKYMFLFVVGVSIFCITTEWAKIIDFNYKNAEQIYIIFQLIILPLWFTFHVFGFKKCINYIISNKKYLCALFVYFVLFLFLCIHYYSDNPFFQNIQFMDNYTPIIYVNVILNVIVLFFAFRGYYKCYFVYYYLCLLFVYLFITLKMFCNDEVIPFHSNHLALFQYIFTVIVYGLISASNLLYFCVIQMLYLQNNDIVIEDVLMRFVYLFCSFFFCNYHCFEFV